jgi:tetratricopeptide (TPR) repeat protein
MAFVVGIGCGNADDKKARAQVAVADSLLLEQEYAAANYHYGRAIQLDPDNVAARIGRARTNFRLNRLEAAGQDLEAVLATDPENGEALRMSGGLLVAQGLPFAGMERLQKAAELYPDNPLAAYRMAEILASSGKYAEAMTALAAAERAMADFAQVDILRAALLTRTGAHTESISAYERAQENYATRGAVFGLGATLVATGKDIRRGCALVAQSLKAGLTLQNTEEAKVVAACKAQGL